MTGPDEKPRSKNTYVHLDRWCGDQPVTENKKPRKWRRRLLLGGIL